MGSDVTTRKWAYNPSIGVLGYGAIPYEGRTLFLFYFLWFVTIRRFKSAPNPLLSKIKIWR